MKESTRNILALLALGGVAFFATRKKDDSDSPGGGGEGPGDSAQGCTDETAQNYDPEALLDDGSCVSHVMGCTDPEAYNYDSNATLDDGSCQPKVLGCTAQTACNFNENANTDDGSCVYADDLYPGEGRDCDGICYEDSDGDDICDDKEVY